MKRKIYDDLVAWKTSGSLKPLMLLGARQVGKTYIIREFCKNEYQKFVEINLLSNKDVIEIYNKSEDSEIKLIKLKALLNENFDDENTILFIDEIQESDNLIAELKFFNEKHPEIKIICAGSLLGVRLKRSMVSFPVGKVKMLNVYPLDFEEFLDALNEKELKRLIEHSFISDKKMDEILHNKALNLYRYYLCIGGMPEVVTNFINNNHDVNKVDITIIKDIVQSYYNDMSKYINNNPEAIKIERIYNSIPTQLANENKKFIFSKIAVGAKKRDYLTALDWLLASNLVLTANNVKKPEIPLKATADLDVFKLFLSDVGILTSLLEIQFSNILLNKISSYIGAITENFVACNLAAMNKSMYYFQSKDNIEIDFIIDTKDGIIPIEVKAGINTKSLSLNKYLDKYHTKYAIRISAKNFGFVNNIKSVPLYAVYCLKDLL